MKVVVTGATGFLGRKTCERLARDGAHVQPSADDRAQDANCGGRAAIIGCVVHQDVMDRFARQTGRSYHLFDYEGAPDAERVIILMGSGTGAAGETVEYLQRQGEKVGILKVRHFRPFDSHRKLSAP